jgi:phosphoserine aminotransferase
VPSVCDSLFISNRIHDLQEIKVIERIYNFSAGPAILPEQVLQKAQSELLSFEGTGMSIMEVSHRSSYFEKVLEGAENGLR